MSANPVLDILRPGLDPGDPWLSAMGGLFAVADIVHVATGEILPGYHPSPLARVGAAPAEYGEDYAVTELWDAYLSDELSDDDMREAFKILNRYADWCELAGRSY